MRTAAIEVFRTGHDWVAHRPSEPGHDCAADDPGPHGVADSETGAVRRLIRAEA